MIVPDSSVLVAGFVVDHPAYDVARAAVAAVRSDGRLVAHTMAETYAVLSAPGGVYRAEPGAALEYLDDLLDDSPPIQLLPGSYREALRASLPRGPGRSTRLRRPDSACGPRRGCHAGQPRSTCKADLRAVRGRVQVPRRRLGPRPLAVVDDEALAEAQALVEAVGVDVGLGRGDRHVFDAELPEAVPGGLDQRRADAAAAAVR